jgi:hypothetical protein
MHQEALHLVVGARKTDVNAFSVAQTEEEAAFARRTSMAALQP